MRHHSVSRETNAADIWAGLAFGFVGCAIFAGSLPATRLAVGAFDPVLVTAGRAVIAGLLSAGLLALRRQAWPDLRLWGRLVIVAIGVVVGFPLFSAYAVRLVPATHGIVFVGLLPLMTAIAAVWRGGERPRPLFWLFAVAGGLIIIAYALIQGWRDGHAFRLHPADFDMLAAVALCGLGYAEGAVVARRLGSWQVICWALILSLPVMLPLFVWLWLETGESLVHLAEAGRGPLLGFAYVCLFSMFIGFFFWYHGLKLGGTARVGQLQLIQSFLGFGLAALLLGETVPPSALIAVGLIVCCIFGARKFA